jgi:hypothetical protein
VGAALARSGLGLVYGGGRVGLMGVVADAALAEGGRVVGVIPEPLALKEIAHDGLTELHVVPGMHERKALMARLSAGFLMLPGGIGTFEEFFEILTWAALGLHRSRSACWMSAATSTRSCACSTTASPRGSSGLSTWPCCWCRRIPRPSSQACGRTGPPAAGPGLDRPGRGVSRVRCRGRPGR